ncbi:MAG: hypothetical protein JWQ21_45 [Herminiimonas sp.]|nr:hypothetical protein [Herminiimonas sp.]
MGSACSSPAADFRKRYGRISPAVNVIHASIRENEAVIGKAGNRSAGLNLPNGEHAGAMTVGG